jgi:hypothetical protein
MDSASESVVSGDGQIVEISCELWSMPLSRRTNLRRTEYKHETVVTVRQVRFDMVGLLCQEGTTPNIFSGGVRGGTPPGRHA